MPSSTRDPFSAEILMARARRTMETLCTAPHISPAFREMLYAARVKIGQSKESAGGPALRVADACWLMYVRLKWPTHAHITAEENAAWNLNQHLQERLSRGKKLARVWEGASLLLNLRKQLLGPLPLLSTPLPPLEEDSPLRTHQRAMSRLHKRWKGYPAANTPAADWLTTALEGAWAVEPSVQLLPALTLFSYLVWIFYASPRDAAKIEAENRAFWHHINRNPWLRNTPMKPLIEILPCRH